MNRITDFFGSLVPGSKNGSPAWNETQWMLTLRIENLGYSAPSLGEPMHSAFEKIDACVVGLSEQVAFLENQLAEERTKYRNLVKALEGVTVKVLEAELRN